MASPGVSPSFAVFASNLTNYAANLAGDVVNIISSIKPTMAPLEMGASKGPAETVTRGYNWTAYAFLLLAFPYIFEFGARKYRDSRLRDHGSPAPVVSSKLPFGVDLAIYSMYRFFRFEFFELVNSWLAAVPGRTVEVRMFGTGLFFTDEPANIKQIMSSGWTNFGRGEVTKRIWGDMLGDTQVFVVDGEDWHNSRERISKHVLAMRPTDLPITEKHVKKFFEYLDDSKAVDICDLLDRYQLDIVTEVFFGESANSLTKNHPVKDAMATLNPINTARILFGKNAYYIKDKFLAPKAMRDLDAYTTSVVDRGFARDLSKKSPDDFTMLEDLCAQGQTYKDIKQSLMSILLGGKDPSSILISWALLSVGKDRRIWDKMQAEVAKVCGNELPTATDLNSLVYIKYVINETFRLFHPLGMNVRVALNNTHLPIGGGKSGKEPLAVSKGTTIIYSLGGLQRRKDIYGDDSLEFRPERWEGVNVNRWHFIPYNHGPRHCIGRKFGQQQMEYILARICQEYKEIRVPPQPEQKVRVELNLKMAFPCHLVFVSKNHDKSPDDYQDGVRHTSVS